MYILCIYAVYIMSNSWSSWKLWNWMCPHILFWCPFMVGSAFIPQRNVSPLATWQNLAHYLLVFCCSAELCDSHKIVKHKWLVTGRLIGYSYKGIQSCFSILYSSVQRDIDFCFLKSGALHQEDAHSKFCLLILEHHFSWHQMPWSTFLILNVVVPSVRLISKVMKALVLLACP